MRRGAGVQLPAGTVTFLFTDIEGSTRLLRDFGPRYGSLTVRHIELLRVAIEGHGGVLFGTSGDAVHAAFVDAAEGVAAAYDAQLALAAEPWPDGVTVKVRMGLHTGQATVIADDYTCLAIVVAARIADAAHGGQVLLSTATREAARLTDGDTVDLGSHQLKDLPSEERLWQLVRDGLAKTFPPPRSLTGTAHNLPVLLTSFVGRERELEDLVSVVAEERLVTVIGPGGVGKTRLAVEATGRLLAGFPGGAWFTDLSAVNEGELVAHAVAAATGFATRGVDPVDAMAAGIGRAPALLVLDNCERVAAGAGALAVALAGRCPNLRVLATSQVPLVAPGERRWTMTTMRVPDEVWAGTPDELNDFDSARLFVERARERRSGFSVDASTAPQIASLCRRLAGNPLAIELAAARAEMLTPAQIEQRLHDQLQLEGDSDTAAPERHRTLRATLEWSYGLLTTQERTLLDRLSVFSGGCTVDSAERICAGDGLDAADIFGLLSNLVQRAFVTTEVAGEGVRFRLLDTVHQFARERLEMAGSEPLARRHLMHFAEVAEENGSRLKGAELAAVLVKLDAEHDNFRTALDAAVLLGDPDAAGSLAANLVPYWEIRGHIAEGVRWLRLIHGLRGVSDDTHAQVGLALGHFSWLVTDYDVADQCYRAALDHFTASSDVAGQAKASGQLALLRRDQGDLDAAVSLLQDQRRLLDEVGTDWQRAGAALNLANVLIVKREADEAAPLLEQSLAVYETLGDPRGIASATSALGVLAQHRGDLPECLRLQQQALAALRELGDRQKIGQLLHNVAAAARNVGDLATARTHYEEAIPVLEELGRTRILVSARTALAELSIQDGALDNAERECAVAIDVAREAGEPYALGFALMTMADILVMRERADEARPVLTEAVENLTLVADRSYLTSSIESAAWIEFKAGDPETSATLFGAITALEPPTKTAARVENAATRAGALDDLRARLRSEVFDRAFSTGQALQFDDALTLMRERVLVTTRDRALQR